MNNGQADTFAIPPANAGLRSETSRHRLGRFAAQLLPLGLAQKLLLHTLEFSSSNELTSAREKLSAFRRWSDDICNRLSRDEDEFRVSGYCAVCDGKRKFIVDYNYASPNARDHLQPNWRERLVCPTCQLNSRLRACVHMARRAGLAPGSRVYATEQVTPLFRALKARFPYLTGSEYLSDGTAPGHTNSAGIRHEDMTRLSFADTSLHGVLSFECLEHIPDYVAALRECRRVLRPGGTLLLTAPFVIDAPTTLTRARLTADGVEHLLPPEYHGDPVNAGGVLCYYHFGWDLLDTLRDAGFCETRLVVYGSRVFGYFGGVPSMIIAKA